jgi:SAM-dependent methyltransferase
VSSGPTLPPAYFDAVYDARDDPWDFETSDYERGKYARTLAALPEPRAGRAFEVGCSIGVLTAALAERCDDLLAVDVSDKALARARARCAALPNVRFERMAFPAERPAPPFDLVLLSEVAYYWSLADLRGGLDWCADALAPGGALVLVHWTHPVHDYPLSGDRVHEEALARTASRLERRHAERHPDYRIDVLVRAAGG